MWTFQGCFSRFQHTHEIQDRYFGVESRTGRLKKFIYGLIRYSSSEVKVYGGQVKYICLDL